ncbi:protein PIN-LIKES 6 isoform X1 [Selaginella moellendorffii]|uniref:protein PIN-LIKES 6 isoform X1 n=1 Tax=Selaginella moellendorffii TaxID=88036 RepID=UPI000D1C7A6E|nr:protein PIN-LIKES 6 isoform X1 [Selaginella moellendorffii]|eukprot:XP_024515184.1 protein PIN-LIKES 6 isoform X1 [Selaginella moellendorffii]
MEAQPESLTRLLQFSVLPIAKVLVMCALGLLMASSYINILNATSRKQLSKLVFQVFLPCLIFTQLGTAVTLEKLLEWWFIPVNVLLSSTLGCLLGLLVALLIKPPPRFFKFTIVMIGIGNIGNIPLVLVGAICRDKNNPFNDPDTCNTDGVAYISYGQWVGAVIVYTFVYRMLAPPASEEEEASKLRESLLVDHSSSEASESDNVVPSTNSKCRKVSQAVARIKLWLQSARIGDILQPPVAASLLALVFGATPFLKMLFLEDDAVFYFLSDSLNILGGAMIPCIMLVLGGNLVKGPGASELGLKTTLAITVVRLVLVPPMGIAVVSLAEKLNLLPPNNKMFRFVLLLQHSMPTSILAGAVASLQGYAEQEASAILFWEHIASVVTMTGWLGVHVNYLS